MLKILIIAGIIVLVLKVCKVSLILHIGNKKIKLTNKKEDEGMPFADEKVDLSKKRQ